MNGIKKTVSSLIFFIPFILLTACTPHQQSYAPPEAPLPQKTWASSPSPKAIIIALHGFNDYSHAFEDAGAFFKAHNMVVIAYDQRGFGKSPHTGIWANEKNLVADLADHVKQASHRWPHVPIYILGESMGGAVAIVSLADPSFPKVQGAILSAPAVWPVGPLYRSVLWVSAHTMPSYTFTGSDLHIMASDNIPMLRALAHDPLFIKETRIDTIYGLAQLMDDAYDEVPAVKVPVLLLYGAHDEVIPRSPVEKSRTRFSAPVEYIYYPDGYHLLTRDLEGHKVMLDILQWIESH